MTLFRLYHHNTPIGLSIHAASADAAVKRARELMPWLPKKLVAYSEEN